MYAMGYWDPYLLCTDILSCSCVYNYKTSNKNILLRTLVDCKGMYSTGGVGGGGGGGGGGGKKPQFKPHNQ